MARCEMVSMVTPISWPICSTKAHTNNGMSSRRSRSAGTSSGPAQVSSWPSTAGSTVVNPVVERYGLVYDITDFSAILSVLSRSGSAEQDPGMGARVMAQSREDQA